MRVEYVVESAWKAAIAQLSKSDIDFSTGTIEDMFIIIHNPESLHKLYGMNYV